MKSRCAESTAAGAVLSHQTCDGYDPRMTDAQYRFGDHLPATFDRIETMTSAAPSPSVRTGLVDLDRLTGGLASGSTTAIFGIPGVGSSTLALNFASAAAFTSDASVLHISWESSIEDRNLRLLSERALIPVARLRAALMDETDWQRLAATMARDAEARFRLVDGPRDLGAVEALIRETADADRERRLVVLDGLPHLARLQPYEDQSVWEEHTRLSAFVKHLALELELPIVYTLPVIADAFRSRLFLGPRLGDVAYSPAYVTDADLVIGVHREDHIERASPRAGEADLMVLKSRYSPVDVIPVAFQGHFGRFVGFDD